MKNDLLTMTVGDRTLVWGSPIELSATLMQPAPCDSPAAQDVDLRLSTVDDTLQASRLVKSTGAFQEDLLEAIRVLKDICRAQGNAAADWKATAESYQATLVSTTKDMNRYFGDWQSAVNQVQLLQADLAKKNLTTEGHGISRKEEETIETLRGRLKGVMETLDQEKRGRLDAEMQIDELKGRLDASHRAAVLALDNQKTMYESRAMDLRGNHANELASLQAMVAQAERDGWHDKLMVRSLSLGMDEAEFDRVSEENWALMKAGVDGKVLSRLGGIVQLTVDPPPADVPHGQLTAEDGEGVHHPPAADLRHGHEVPEGGEKGENLQPEEHRESVRARVTITTGELKCSSCGEILTAGNRYLLASGNYNCEECWDVAMAVADSKGGAA